MNSFCKNKKGSCGAQPLVLQYYNLQRFVVVDNSGVEHRAFIAVAYIEFVPTSNGTRTPLKPWATAE